MQGHNPHVNMHDVESHFGEEEHGSNITSVLPG